MVMKRVISFLLCLVLIWLVACLRDSVTAEESPSQTLVDAFQSLKEGNMGTRLLDDSSPDTLEQETGSGPEAGEAEPTDNRGIASGSLSYSGEDVAPAPEALAEENTAQNTLANETLTYVPDTADPSAAELEMSPSVAQEPVPEIVVGSKSIAPQSPAGRDGVPEDGTDSDEQALEPEPDMTKAKKPVAEEIEEFSSAAEEPGAELSKVDETPDPPTPAVEEDTQKRVANPDIPKQEPEPDVTEAEEPADTESEKPTEAVQELGVENSSGQNSSDPPTPVIVEDKSEDAENPESQTQELYPGLPQDEDIPLPEGEVPVLELKNPDVEHIDTAEPEATDLPLMENEAEGENATSDTETQDLPTEIPVSKPAEEVTVPDCADDHVANESPAEAVLNDDTNMSTKTLPGQNHQHALELMLDRRAENTFSLDGMKEHYYRFDVQRNGTYTLQSDGIALAAELYEGTDKWISRIAPTIVSDTSDAPQWIKHQMTLRRGVTFYLVVRSHRDEAGSYALLLSHYIKEEAPAPEDDPLPVSQPPHDESSARTEPSTRQTLPPTDDAIEDTPIDSELGMPAQPESEVLKDEEQAIASDAQAREQATQNTITEQASEQSTSPAEDPTNQTDLPTDARELPIDGSSQDILTEQVSEIPVHIDENHSGNPDPLPEPSIPPQSSTEPTPLPASEEPVQPATTQPVPPKPMPGTEVGAQEPEPVQYLVAEQVEQIPSATSQETAPDDNKVSKAGAGEVQQQVIDISPYLLTGLTTKPGDANGDGVIDADDLLSIIDYLVLGILPPAPQNSDANEDLEVDIKDLEWLIDYMHPLVPAAEGRFIIRNQRGQYLSVINGSLACSPADNGSIWELKLAENGAFYIYAENLYEGQLLDVDNLSDHEGNIVKLFHHTGYLSAQTWHCVPQTDGSYLISTVLASGRVLTENGAEAPTIQTYTGNDRQKWIMTPSSAPYRPTSKFLGVTIGTEDREIVIHPATGHTDASLKQLLADNGDKHNLVEGQHVLLHLPNEVWDGYADPKKVIDTYDAIYQAEYELIGGKVKIYDGKLPFLTDLDTDIYMYCSSHCGQSLDAAWAIQNHWNRGEMRQALWGVGHEMGHAMTIRGMGLIYGDFEAESWVNVPNVYALKKLGLYSEAKQAAFGYAKDYPGSNGRAYDDLPDNERDVSILLENTHVFIKLPILLADHYGWAGMQQFCTKATQDHAQGISTGRDTQSKIDYMVQNLSTAYGMDVSNLFERWKLYPSSAVKMSVSTLPPETSIYSVERVPVQEGRYKIRHQGGQYLSVVNDVLVCSDVDNGSTWELKLAQNGAFQVYAGTMDLGRLLDLDNDQDVEGNIVKLFHDTGYLNAQTWQFEPNGDGTHQIRTVHGSGRVLTGNGLELPTIQTYTGADTQVWVLTPVE
jgi:hypothetical protein